MSRFPSVCRVEVPFVCRLKISVSGLDVSLCRLVFANRRPNQDKKPGRKSNARGQEAYLSFASPHTYPRSLPSQKPPVSLGPAARDAAPVKGQSTDSDGALFAFCGPRVRAVGRDDKGGGRVRDVLEGQDGGGRKIRTGEGGFWVRGGGARPCRAGGRCRGAPRPVSSSLAGSAALGHASRVLLPDKLVAFGRPPSVTAPEIQALLASRHIPPASPSASQHSSLPK